MRDGTRTRDHRGHNPVLYLLSYPHHVYLARLAGLEPATYGLEVRRSIQLSYRRASTSMIAHENDEVNTSAPEL